MHLKDQANEEWHLWIGQDEIKLRQQLVAEKVWISWGQRFPNK